jgi:hypothetical protein
LVLHGPAESSFYPEIGCDFPDFALGRLPRLVEFRMKRAGISCVVFRGGMSMQDPDVFHDVMCGTGRKYAFHGFSMGICKCLEWYFWIEDLEVKQLCIPKSWSHPY